MIKFVVVVWISGITTFGNITEDKYLVALFDNIFDSKAACQEYVIQSQDDWFAKLSKDATLSEGWHGLVMNEDPECVPYNSRTKEVYDEGPTL